MKPDQSASENVSIKYIGKRQTHTDVLYGTRIVWSAPGESHLVPTDKALQMLKVNHDVYALGDETDEVESSAVPVQKAEDDVDKLQATMDSIANMNKAELKSFAKTCFRVDLTGNVADMRTEAANMVHRFGVQ